MTLEDLARTYASGWVPANTFGWTLDDCDCEPEIEHCTRCDGRRLMLAVSRLAGTP